MNTRRIRWRSSLIGQSMTLQLVLACSSADFTHVSRSEVTTLATPPSLTIAAPPNAEWLEADVRVVTTSSVLGREVTATQEYHMRNERSASGGHTITLTYPQRAQGTTGGPRLSDVIREIVVLPETGQQRITMRDGAVIDPAEALSHISSRTRETTLPYNVPKIPRPSEAAVAFATGSGDPSAPFKQTSAVLESQGNEARLIAMERTYGSRGPLNAKGRYLFSRSVGDTALTLEVDAETGRTLKARLTVNGSESSLSDCTLARVSPGKFVRSRCHREHVNPKTSTKFATTTELSSITYGESSQ